jgi:hypothetical protein
MIHIAVASGAKTETTMSLFGNLFSRRSPRKSSGLPRRRSARPTLEALEDRTLLTIVLPPAGTSGPANVTGTSGNDVFFIRLQPGTPSNIQFSDNGGATFATAPIANITAVGVFGLAGQDALLIDNTFGFVANVGNFPISFDGGTGFDTLVLAGNPGGSSAFTETYTPGPVVANGGVISLTNNIQTQTITFTHVAQVTDVFPAGTLNVTLNDNPHYVQIINGTPVLGTPTTRIVGADRFDPNDTLDDNFSPTIGFMNDFTSQSFVPIDFQNKSSVFLLTGNGGDFVALNNPNPAVGLGNLTLNGGTGVNLGIERSMPPGVALASSNFVRVDTAAPTIFIDELYELRLGRAPSLAEVGSWQNVLGGPGGPSAVASGIERSNEARFRLVMSWYIRYLGRQPNGGEEQSWVNLLIAGHSEEEVLSDILGSQEFFMRASALFNTGTANGNYIMALYSLVLNRTPTTSEFNAWLRVVTSTNRIMIANDFLGSTEFRADMVTAFYLVFLHRPPDAAGVAGWASSQMDLTGIRISILSSQEFINNG